MVDSKKSVLSYVQDPMVAGGVGAVCGTLVVGATSPSAPRYDKTVELVAAEQALVNPSGERGDAYAAQTDFVREQMKEQDKRDRDRRKYIQTSSEELAVGIGGGLLAGMGFTELLNRRRKAKEEKDKGGIS